jgi:hypothetical protein
VHNLTIVFFRINYITVDALLHTFNFPDLADQTESEKVHHLQLGSVAGVLCHLNVSRYDYRFLCNCQDPAWVDASHCPRVAPLRCPKHSSVIINALQICDGTADCPDAYDENFCEGTLAIVSIRDGSTVAVGSAGACFVNLPVVVRNGLLQMPSRRVTDENGHPAICFAAHGVMRSWEVAEGQVGSAALWYALQRHACMCVFLGLPFSLACYSLHACASPVALGSVATSALPQDVL